MMYRIEVWADLHGARNLAGEMICDIGHSGHGKGAFRYDAGYLRHPSAFALDPVSLPLQPGNFTVSHPGVFGVFEDSLPDDWGRRLLIRKHLIPLHQQNLPTLLLTLGATGLGALAYSEHGSLADAVIEPSLLDLEQLTRQAELFERGESRDADISLLMGAGSSPGGARPKALVYDSNTGEHFIAKFASVKDHVDVVRIEAATMNLAARAGLIVPDTRLVQCCGQPVLLVRRFDLKRPGRRHMISMQTLLKVTGYYQCRYEDMLNAVRKVSADPADDVELLFRQMVFNAVIDNTDDHLKNFWMLFDHETGWRLSPAFDLVPDIGQRGEHILFFDLSSVYPGRKKLENQGRAWGVRHAAGVIEEVFTAVSGWRDEFAACGVRESDIAQFRQIDYNLQG